MGFGAGNEMRSEGQEGGRGGEGRGLRRREGERDFHEEEGEEREGEQRWHPEPVQEGHGRRRARRGGRWLIWQELWVGGGL